MYGEELSLQLSSEQQGSGLFSTTRRKAQVNNGCREFARLTDCVKKNGSLTLVDETATYDLEATFTDYWWLSRLEGVSIAIVNGSTTRYLVEGRDFIRKDKRRLDREHPGWRGWSPGSPRLMYLDTNGGQLLLGFAPAPDFATDDVWTATVPYVPEVPDMSADVDEPFTFSSNVVKHLRPWHMAPVHYAAHKLEWSRKRYDVAKEQLALFSALVADYHDKQGLPGGDSVAIIHDYMAAVNARGTFAGDGMVDW